MIFFAPKNFPPLCLALLVSDAVRDRTSSFFSRNGFSPSKPEFTSEEEVKSRVETVVVSQSSTISPLNSTHESQEIEIKE